MSFAISGKCSTFGGPYDKGVSPSEGLALVEPSDLDQLWFRRLFLPEQPANTTGLARRLDPKTYYCAMRWAYTSSLAGEDGRLPIVTTREELRKNYVVVGNGTKTFRVRPVDWGPHVDTGRVIDLSPGLAEALGVGTDDNVTVFITWK